jgi:hypothetical protein
VVECMAKAAKKKAAGAKKTTPKAQQAEAIDLREVRVKVKNAIGGRAEELATAVTDDAVKKAQAQQMKLLFELIGLFPESQEEREAAGDDQALAKVLLERLGLPDEPAVNEEEAEEQRELQESARALMSAPFDPVK